MAATPDHRDDVVQREPRGPHGDPRGHRRRLAAARCTDQGEMPRRAPRAHEAVSSRALGKIVLVV
jgi:hypothetical protein